MGLGPTPEQLSTLLVTGGPRSVSKVVLLAFAEPSQAPLVAVKAPRVRAAAAGVRREALALARLTGRRSEPTPGVPRLLFCREIDGVRSWVRRRSPAAHWRASSCRFVRASRRGLPWPFRYPGTVSHGRPALRAAAALLQGLEAPSRASCVA